METGLKFDFSRIDVVDFLEELNIRNVRDEGFEVFYSCPFPGHSHMDTNPSASMQQGTTVAHCFGCGWKGNALTFLADFEGVSPVTAIRWLRQRFGDDFQEPQGSFVQEMEELLKRNQVQEKPPLVEPDERECSRRAINWIDAKAVWAVAPHEVPLPIKYMLDRGFSSWVLEDYDIGFDRISQRITIPYRDYAGKLVGFKGRAFDPDQTRYITLGGSEYGFDPVKVGDYLFGLDQVLTSEDYKTSPICVIREGELNVLALRQHLYSLVVGVSGKRLSSTQIELIKKYFGKVAVWFDDVADSIRAAEQLEPFMKVRMIRSDKDPAEMTEAEIKDAFSSSFTLWDLRFDLGV